MSTWIALFRGINVGGNCRLPMAELRVQLEACGLSNVRTYIQSGNVIFEAGRPSKARLAAQIIDSVEQHQGFRPAVLLLTATELHQAIENNPYTEAISQPQTLHFFFLEQPARQPNVAMLEQVRDASESYELTDQVFYLHTPKGLGRSKLAARVEKLLAVWQLHATFAPSVSYESY